MSREIDVKVATEIMGWIYIEGEYGHPTESGPFKDCDCPSHSYQKTLIPHYSSDIAAAFDLVKKARETFSHDEWKQFCTELCNDWRILCGGTAEYIALAALKAKGIEVG